jgi:glycerol uptake facilitator-like aquaporin
MKQYIGEMVGTFFVAVAVAFGAGPIAIGCMFALMMYVGASTKSGYYNPVITFTLWLRSLITTTELMYFVCAQVIGTLAATALSLLISGGLFAFTPEVFLYWGLMEILFGALLSLVALACVVPMMRGVLPSIYSFVMGAVLMVIAFMNGLCNPVIALTTLVLNLLVGGLIVEWKAFAQVSLVYLLCPLIGSFLANAYYNYKGVQQK